MGGLGTGLGFTLVLYAVGMFITSRFLVSLLGAAFPHFAGFPFS